MSVFIPLIIVSRIFRTKLFVLLAIFCPASTPSYQVLIEIHFRFGASWHRDFDYFGRESDLRRN